MAFEKFSEGRLESAVHFHGAVHVCGEKAQSEMGENDELKIKYQKKKGIDGVLCDPVLCARGMIEDLEIVVP